MHASNGELAHAIVDFTVDGPVKVSVVSVTSSEDATVMTAGLSLLSNTGMHLRGSFPGAELQIETTAAPRRVRRSPPGHRALLA